MKKKGVRKRSLFNPDQVLARLNQAVMRDLLPVTQKYDKEWDPIGLLSYRQVDEFRKKYSSPLVSQEKLEELTYEKFHSVNSHMGSYRDTIVCDNVHISHASPRDLILRRAQALLKFVLGDINETEIFLRAKNSTGSSIGVSYSDTSNEAKFRFPISTTSRVAPLLDRYFEYDYQLYSAVKDFNSDQPLVDKYEIVEGSRATTVPKTNQIRRMICVEPTGNMFLQQGLMHCFYHRMEKVGLCLDSLPDRHRQLALESSITGKFATIDWSSASDCVSIELLRFLLPPKWFYWAEILRSPKMRIDNAMVELNMFSTMGNAVTFPLETLVFWSLGHAVIMEQKRSNSLFPEWEELKNCSVFGDDCIVPTHVAPRFIEVLTEFGFLVNDDKSFYGSRGFRESCGGDYLLGYDVRPYHCKAPSSTRVSALEPWLYIIVNSLLKKYITCFGELSYIYDKSLFVTLSQLFREFGLTLKFCPTFYPDDAGLKLTFDVQRFLLCYDFRVSTISVSEHGVYRFQYLKFQYRKRYKRDDGLAYALWLKKPKGPELVPSHWINRRRIGGYVVARGRTCHWHVPKLY